MLITKIDTIAKQSFIKSTEIRSLLIQGFDFSVGQFLEDGLLSTDEENKVTSFKNQFEFTQNELNQRGSMNKIVQSSILREILNGNIPENRIKVEGALPFNFLKDEKLIWIFPNTNFHEQKTTTQYVGRSSGMSVRIAKGVYYRTGIFRGHPVSTTEMTFVDRGILAVTDKYLYFGSGTKNFRIKYDKIVSINPYEDGIGIQKDGTSSKPQIFSGIDGWFIYNVISHFK